MSETLSKTALAQINKQLQDQVIDLREELKEQDRIIHQLEEQVEHLLRVISRTEALTNNNPNPAVLQANIILNNELKGEGNEYVINNLWATQNQESYEPSEIEYNLREDVRVLTETIQQLRNILQSVLYWQSSLTLPASIKERAEKLLQEQGQ
jgi:hypothetical protein